MAVAQTSPNQMTPEVLEDRLVEFASLRTAKSQAISDHNQ